MENAEERFKKFTEELRLLSLKYGVAIQSTGGVHIGKFKDVRYDTDHTSGDLDVDIEWEEKI